jgi:vitamin B12 transporter
MQDVVITGTRGSIELTQLSTSVRVIDSLDLTQANGVTLAEKIRHSAGISMRSYGGNGALQSVSFRGLGSDYSLILIDGQRFTSFQISTVDVGIFQMNEIERIEIAPGGNSSQYGSDAVGGVINIVTKKPDAGTFLTIAQTFGSYGLSGYSVTAGGGDAAYSFRGGLDIRRASNNFKFLFNDGITEHILQRSGSDYLLKNYSFSTRTAITDEVESRSTVRYSVADRGQPSAATNAQQNNHGRINDHDLFMNSITEMNFDGSWTLTVPITYHTNRQTYFDPAVIMNGLPLDARYENNTFGTSPLIRYSLSSDHHFVSGAELTIASISSNEVFPSRREQISGFAASEHHLQFLTDVILYPSIRFDTFSDTDGDISPKLGINIGLWQAPSVRLRASYGKNFRVPTFNDLYWIGGGNPHLSPERSINLDAGLTAGLKSDDIDVDIELNYFSIDASNKIVWQPVAGTLWRPVNLQSVSSRGFEGRLSVNLWANLLMIDYSHNILSAKKISEDLPGDASKDMYLPHVPKEYSSFSIGSSLEALSVNLTYSFTGFRFETSDNNPRFILPAHDNIDANISYGVNVNGIWIRFRGEMNNLMNDSHVLFRGYPMPLRHYSFTTLLSF